MKKLFLIGLILIANLFNLNCQNFFEIEHQNSKLKVEIYKINDIIYIPLKDFKYLFNNSFLKISYSSINYKKEELIFSDKSFFVVYKNSEIMRIAQMSHPVISFNNLILIPIIQFLNSLKGLELLNFEIVENKKIKITNQKILNELVNNDSSIIIQNNTLEESSNKENNTEQKNQNNNEFKNIYKFIDTIDVIKGKYTIPKNIKK
jgi:hypothetical protein